MADRNPTQIAQQIERIETAKDILSDKAINMGLSYYDPDEGIATLRPVTTNDRIDVLADAFDQIPVRTSANISLDDTCKTVEIQAGYYHDDQSKSIPDATVEVASEIDHLNGNISIYVNAQNSGYVGQGRIATSSSGIHHPSLSEENIKSGVTIFGHTGTFTGDATITTTATDEPGVYESDELVVGNTAYARGCKVIGTLVKHPDTPIFFNPLIQDYIDLGTMKYTGQHVRLDQGTDGKSSLLKRLEAI